MRLPYLPLLLLAAPVSAQVTPRPGPGDPRIQTVLYDPDQVVVLHVASGYELSVAFAADERIENVAVGDSGAWQVVPNKRGDHLFIKALDGGAATNMTVITDARSYQFELTPGSGDAAPYAVTFDYARPRMAPPGAAAMERVAARYRLHGTRAIRPDAIHDDGQKTYMIWRADQPQPAIFAIDAHGKETLVNGAMRDGRYVVDSVADRLVFRLDRRTASAVRKPEAQ